MNTGLLLLCKSFQVTICVISVDRYLAVTRPLRYKSVVTKFKVILVMIMIWSFSSTILLTTVRWDQPHCTDEVTHWHKGDEPLKHSVAVHMLRRQRDPLPRTQCRLRILPARLGHADTLLEDLPASEKPTAGT